MRSSLQLSFLSTLLLIACGGSGGAAATRTTVEPGSVLVVVDTRAGDDAIVQFQLTGATLEDPLGRQTGNLLVDANMLTLSTFGGEPSGLRLRQVPSGDYRALHLVLVPGSGLALDDTGATRPVSGPVDLRVPITDGLLHNERLASWLVIGHDEQPLSEQGNALVWSPSMSARMDGETIGLGELAQPIPNESGVMTTAGTVGDGLLQLLWQTGCIFEDDAGNPYPDGASFLSALDRGDELRCHGALDREGRMRCDRVRRGRQNERPRLIGRIVSLDELNEQFRFDVQATTRAGNFDFLVVPEQVVVLAAEARIVASNGAPLAFAALAVGQLAKIEWVLRTPIAGDLPQIKARRIEIPSGNSARLRPQILGRVQSVDVASRTIVVVPQNGQAIRIRGTAVAQVAVHVPVGASIERKPAEGGQPFAIGIQQIQPLDDRIWVRGTVTGQAEIEADRVRVRQR